MPAATTAHAATLIAVDRRTSRRVYVCPWMRYGAAGPRGSGREAGSAAATPPGARVRAAVDRPERVAAGNGIYFVAIAWQVYELSNSPEALSIVGFA